MFESLQTNPPDPILAVTQAYRADTDPNKIDLCVGVYRDKMGRTPILAAVRLAEKAVLRTQTTKSYLGVAGNPLFNQCVAKLVLGSLHDKLKNRLALIQTAGGSGALRTAAEFLHFVRPSLPVFFPEPTWINHFALFAGAHLKQRFLPYFDSRHHRLDIDALCDRLASAPEQSTIVLQASCHNPTGLDPTPGQWMAITDIIAKRKLFPVLDLAYQGLGTGLEDDTAVIRLMALHLPEMLIAVSCSKNFGLYRERVGLLIGIANSSAAAKALASQLERLVAAFIPCRPTTARR